jgi:hypothetical protein
VADQEQKLAPRLLRRADRLLAIGVVCATSFLLLPARAAMEPDNVASEIQNAMQLCRKMGGTPDVDAMLSVDDFNGDGGEDWIVDYKKLQCAGTANPFCGSGGCTLQVFLWSGGSKWNKAFDELVRSYKFVRTGGQRALEVQLGGAACGKPNAQSCAQTYRFIAGGRLVPAR